VALREVIAPLIDRGVAELSPIEHAVLLIGAFELKNNQDIPYRVVINEAVELTKSFGGIDGHKYVNGVLDKLAPKLRGDEVAADTRR
jgi:N utilization substance protein B